MRRTPMIGVLLSIALAPTARAAEPSAVERAKEAYDRGADAFRSSDYARAARAFALADELAPNDVALQAALEAAVLADDVLLGYALLARAHRGATTDALERAVRRAHEKFDGRAGRLHVVCPGRGRCVAAVDGAEVDLEASPWVLSGEHSLLLASGTDRRTRSIEVAADRTTELDLSAEIAPPMESATARVEAKDRGFEPLWFWMAAGASVVLGGITVASAVDVADQHSAFVAAACPEAANPGCAQRALDGESAQRRTWALAASTGIAAAVSMIIGLIFVDWTEGAF
jgi:hypothetical protein